MLTDPVPADPVLKVEDLSAGYAGAEVIRNINITVGSGEVVALFGPNGAGKTTTLRAISGIIKPSRGTITFAGTDLASQSPTQRARAGIAHVPEGRGIFYGLTVAEHFRLGYRGEHIDPAVVYSYFAALEPLQDRRAGLLSGGEQQMLAVGRALGRRPKLLLLDELSLGLAPLLVERLLPVVRQYAQDSGCAVLLVEQHVQLATEIADRCYVLSHGDIVLHETGQRLISDPSLLVASYVGQHQDAPEPGKAVAGSGA
ncbi:MAG: ABC transporter ATP-binding protein [Actinobacteria bacterium]|nr:ABC transporter ATP-binding protein [Actinomycetota bacterium]